MNDSIVSSIPAGTLGGPPRRLELGDEELNRLRVEAAEKEGWPRVEIVSQHRRYLVADDGACYRLRSGLVWGRGKASPEFVHANDSVPWALIDGRIVCLEETGVRRETEAKTPNRRRRLGVTR